MGCDRVRVRCILFIAFRGVIMTRMAIVALGMIGVTVLLATPCFETFNETNTRVSGNIEASCNESNDTVRYLGALSLENPSLGAVRSLSIRPVPMIHALS